jgi:hypothetical protein
VTLATFILVYFSTLHWVYTTMSADLLSAAKKESISTSAILVMALYRSFDLETDKREMLSFLLGSKKYRQNMLLTRVVSADGTIVSSTGFNEIGQTVKTSFSHKAMDNQTSTHFIVNGHEPYLKVFYSISAGLGSNNQPVGFIETDYDISPLTLTLSNLRFYFILGGLFDGAGAGVCASLDSIDND